MRSGWRKLLETGVFATVKEIAPAEKINASYFGRVLRLVGVTLKPWRPGLPFGQPGVVFANRHLDLRQTLFVEDFVLRDHLVHEEQVGRQRIDLIGGESPLIPERHGAMDEIPHRRRKRRGQWQYALPFPDGDILAL